MVAFSTAPTANELSKGTDDQGRAASKYQHHALLVFAALVSWGFLVLINIPLWDDWVLLAYSKAGTFWEFFKQMGRREQYVLIAPFAAFGEPRAWIGAALLLSCVFPSLVYIVLRQGLRWPTNDAFWAALLTGIVPLNQARFILSTLPYAFSSLFFLLALVLLLRDLRDRHLARRIAIGILLMMAFSTNSFLVLSWVAPALVGITAWRDSPKSSSIAQSASAALKGVTSRSELLLLPFVYWGAKQLLEPSYGLYANYNKFRMPLPVAIKETVIATLDQIRGSPALLPASADLPELVLATGIAVSIFAALAWTLGVSFASRSGEHDDTASHRIGTILTLAICGALVLSALFPYVIVGQPPRFSGLWETRHQTTLTLVSGFVIIAMLRAMMPRKLIWISASAICTLFLILDLSFTQRMLSDARETNEILQIFKHEPSPPGTMILVVEDDRSYRALDRFFPFYELSFLANGGKSGPNLAISNREVLDPASGTIARSAIPAVISALSALCETHRQNPQYGFGGFSSNGQIETARLLESRRPLGFFEGIGQSLGVSKTPPASVRIDKHVEPLQAACRGSCCTDG